MKSQNQYIISKLQELNKLISSASITYAYDDTTDFHIVEVSPENIRRQNQAFIDAEYRFLKDLEIEYPGINFYFSEPSILNDMSNTLYCSLVGVAYENKTDNVFIINHSDNAECFLPQVLLAA